MNALSGDSLGPSFPWPPECTVQIPMVLQTQIYSLADVSSVRLDKTICDVKKLMLTFLGRESTLSSNRYFTEGNHRHRPAQQVQIRRLLHGRLLERTVCSAIFTEGKEFSHNCLLDHFISPRFAQSHAIETHVSKTAHLPLQFHWTVFSASASCTDTFS